MVRIDGDSTLELCARFAIAKDATEGYSNIRVTDMCLPENKSKGAFCRKKGVIGRGIKKDWTLFGVNVPK